MCKYSKEDYMKLANVSCLDVALALGMTIDEGGKTTDKSVHVKDSGGLYIFPDKNNWYRHSDGAKVFPVDLVADALNCSREQALDFIAKTVVNGVNTQESYYVPNACDRIVLARSGTRYRLPYFLYLLSYSSLSIHRPRSGNAGNALRSAVSLPRTA